MQTPQRKTSGQGSKWPSYLTSADLCTTLSPSPVVSWSKNIAANVVGPLTSIRTSNIDFQWLIHVSATSDLTYVSVDTTLRWKSMFNISMRAVKPKFNVPPQRDVASRWETLAWQLSMATGRKIMFAFLKCLYWPFESQSGLELNECICKCHGFKTNDMSQHCNT